MPRIMRLQMITRDPMNLSETNPVIDKGTLLLLEGSPDRFAIADGVTPFAELTPMVGELSGPIDF